MSNKLSKILIEKIKNYKEILKEVETISMEQTLDNFNKDRCPESEIFIWECIALAYKNYTSNKQNLSLAKKKEILSVLLGLSMGMDKLNHIKLLNSEEIKQITRTYQD